MHLKWLGPVFLLKKSWKALWRSAFHFSVMDKLIWLVGRKVTRKVSNGPVYKEIVVWLCL